MIEEERWPVTFDEDGIYLKDCWVHLSHHGLRLMEDRNGVTSDYPLPYGSYLGDLDCEEEDTDWGEQAIPDTVLKLYQQSNCEEGRLYFGSCEVRLKHLPCHFLQGTIKDLDDDTISKILIHIETFRNRDGVSADVLGELELCSDAILSIRSQREYEAQGGECIE